MRNEPITPTTCDHCGEHFNTSEVHPRSYCSIACEEGRAPVPQSDPTSPNFWVSVKSDPETLVGHNLVANGLKRTCYSPEWHRDPDSYTHQSIVSLDTQNEVLVVKNDVYLGYVKDYRDGQFVVVDRYGEETNERWVEASVAVDQLRTERWWAE